MPMGQRLGVRQSREPMTRSVSSTRLTSTHDGLNLDGSAPRACRFRFYQRACPTRAMSPGLLRLSMPICRPLLEGEGPSLDPGDVVLDRDRRGSMLASRILPRQCSAGNNLRSVTWDVWDVPLGIERSSNPRGDGVPGVCSFRVPTPFQNPASQVSRLIIHPVAIVSRTDWLGGGIYE